jgi:hypothetical protein
VKAPLKLTLFAAGLIAVFAAALGIGRLAGPAPTPSGAAHTADGGQHGGDGGQHGDPAEPSTPAGTRQLPGGLQVAADGYRLVPAATAAAAGTQAPYAFRIIGPDDAPVTRYTPTHDRDMHLIVVRRDMSGFQHLHPTLGADGVWTVPLRLEAAGTYRVFADFQPAARAEPLTLGVDLAAPGAFQPAPPLAESPTATVDGYTVTLDGALVPGASSKLTLTVTKDGRPVTDLQPYLAAYGHLVALRDGDLAYLHVHPDGTPGDGRTAAGPQIVFHVEVPSSGMYGLFLDFQHNGVVRTAQFTAHADAHKEN